MSLPACFPDELHLMDWGMRGESRVFKLDHYFRYISSRGEITVPTGFLTDGASIPSPFWSILSPFGPYFPAALIHDYLYSHRSDAHHRMSRRDADLIFKEAMFNLGVGWLTRETIFRAVRLFGGPSYKPHRHA